MTSALVPLTVQDALAVATQLASSGMVPRDYAGKPGAIYAAIDLGASVGLRPMQACQGIANINGRPALWGDAALGVVMAHPAFESIDEDDASKATAQGFGRCRVVRKGSPPYEVRFTVDMAKAAGLWGKAGPWTQYPGRMLQMRSRSWAFRDRFADALKGIAVAEEVMDITGSSSVVEDRPSLAEMMPREEAPPQSVATPAESAPPDDDTAGLLEVGISAVDVATGKTRAGKPWTRYGVTLAMPDGSTMLVGTFSSTVGGAAQAAIGKRARVAVTSRDANGKTFHDLTECSPV